MQTVVGEYTLLEEIGSGSFAVVFKGRHNITGDFVAVKAIRKEKLNKKLLESLESEISILKGLDHPNIVRLLCVEKSADKIYLIFEYLPGGDLQKLLRVKRTLPEPVARRFLQQLAQGLMYIHERNTIHRDLKPSNLLLTEASFDATIKIADFGFARHMQPLAMAETMCGSPLYMAPEILQFQKYDARADLWSVGAMLYEMLLGKPPFRGRNHVELLQNIQTQELVAPSALVVSEPCIDLIKQLLQKNPVDRIGYEEFFAHPFVGLARSPPRQRQSAAAASGAHASPSRAGAASSSGAASASSAPAAAAASSRAEQARLPSAPISLQSSLNLSAASSKQSEDDFILVGSDAVPAAQAGDAAGAAPAVSATGVASASASASASTSASASAGAPPPEGAMSVPSYARAPAGKVVASYIGSAPPVGVPPRPPRDQAGSGGMPVRDFSMAYFAPVVRGFAVLSQLTAELPTDEQASIVMEMIRHLQTIFDVCRQIIAASPPPPEQGGRHRSYSEPVQRRALGAPGAPDDSAFERQRCVMLMGWALGQLRSCMSNLGQCVQELPGERALPDPRALIWKYAIGESKRGIGSELVGGASAASHYRAALVLFRLLELYAHSERDASALGKYAGLVQQRLVALRRGDALQL